jgi:hypothetical protein
MAVEKSDAGDEDDGQREAKCSPGEKSLHSSILTQALDLPRRR